VGAEILGNSAAAELVLSHGWTAGAAVRAKADSENYDVP
jgi:hypothetical protein